MPKHIKASGGHPGGPRTRHFFDMAAAVDGDRLINVMREPLQLHAVSLGSGSMDVRLDLGTSADLLRIIADQRKQVRDRSQSRDIS